MVDMKAKGKTTASITARVIRKDGKEEFHVATHPWKPWQRWWWTKILRRPLPVRGRIPKWQLW